MNSKLTIKALFIIISLFSYKISICESSFILVNKSGYDIFCRDRSIEQAQDNKWTSPENSNIVLKPGERVQLSLSKSYSIRTAGKKSALSNYYNVPKPLELAKATLSREDEIAFSSAMWNKELMPIISVYAGLVYGWKFTLSHTWTNNTKEQQDKPGERWNKEWTNIEKT